MAFVVATVFMAIFLVASAFGWGLEDPRRIIDHAGIVPALISVGLLVVDVVAPVPASLVMVANGALFGIVIGALLSTVGSIGAFAAGFALGRRGTLTMARVLGDEQARRADAMLHRHGALAVAVTRPLPILAETTALLAGASTMSWSRALAAAATGVIPQAIVYALVGAAWTSFAPESLAFLAVVLVAFVVWGLMARLPRGRSALSTGLGPCGEASSHVRRSR